MDLSEWKITCGRPERRRMDRTDRIDLTVEDFIKQIELYLLGVEPRECEYHCILDTNQ